MICAYEFRDIKEMNVFLRGGLIGATLTSYAGGYIFPGLGGKTITFTNPTAATVTFAGAVGSDVTFASAYTSLSTPGTSPSKFVPMIVNGRLAIMPEKAATYSVQLDVVGSDTGRTILGMPLVATVGKRARIGGTASATTGDVVLSSVYFAAASSTHVVVIEEV